VVLGRPAGTIDLVLLAGTRDVRPRMPLGRLRHITLPLLTPTIFFNLVLGVITAFSFFSQALVASSAPTELGGGGGSLGSQSIGGPVDSTLFYSLYLYQQIFSYFQLGYASAMTWLLTLTVMILTAFIFGTARKWVYYHGSDF